MDVKVLLVGRLLRIVEDTRAQAAAYGADLYGATNLEEAKRVLAEHRIDAVIMGAGVDLEQRLAIARAAFEASDRTEVHMKDKASGPQGFPAFVNDLLAMRAKNMAHGAQEPSA